VKKWFDGIFYENKQQVAEIQQIINLKKTKKETMKKYKKK
jgi:hypothetical protein